MGCGLQGGGNNVELGDEFRVVAVKLLFDFSPQGGVGLKGKANGIEEF